MEEKNKNVIIVNEDNNTEDKTFAEPKKAKREHHFWKKYGRPSLVSFLALAFFTGVAYPVATTVAAQILFPVQANGSQITVTLADGTKRTYGSELVGQQFDHGYYLIGRDNTATTNLSPEGAEFNRKVASREERLVLAGYRIKGTRVDTIVRNEEYFNVRHYTFESDDGSVRQVPDVLLTAAGSGIDPQITEDAATWQIDDLYRGRNAFYAADGEYADRLIFQDASGADVVYALKSDDPDYDAEKDPESYLSLKLDASGNPVTVPYAGAAYAFGVDDDGNPVKYEGDSVQAVREQKGDHEYPKDRIEAAISKYTKPRWLYLIGEPTVNVLCVNLALDGLLAL